MTEIKIVRGKGRGIFATKDIRKGTLVEKSQLIFFPRKEEKYIEKTILADYYFEYDQKLNAIALGNGSLYNHNRQDNIIFIQKNKMIYFYAIKNIKKGEELLLDYNDKKLISRFEKKR